MRTLQFYRSCVIHIAFACLAILAFTKCSDHDLVNIAVSTQTLKVWVTANDPVTKAIITDGFLPNKSSIGVALLNANEEAVESVNYNYTNVKFTASGENEGQVWVPEEEVYLAKTIGTAYAYYPYSESVTDVSSIPVTTTGQTDYLYAKHENLSNTASTATFAMKHALAVVSLTVVKGSYSGTGALTQASVRGPGICTGGKMNAKVDALVNPLHSFTGASEPVTVTSSFTLSEGGDDVDLIVIPNGQSSAFRITLTIDGKEYTTATSEIKLEPGNRYHYTVTADERQLALSSVTIGDWGYSESGSPTIMVGGYSVKLAGNLSGLAFNSTVSDGAVTIQARPKTGVWVPSSITATAGATMTSNVEGEGLITIQLSNFTDDVTVTIDGYAVSLAGDLNKLAFNSKVSDGAVTIEARPVGDLWVSTGVSATSDATMNKSVADDGSVTVSLSNITANTTVTFTGYVVTFVGDNAGMLVASKINEDASVNMRIVTDNSLPYYMPNEVSASSGSLTQSVIGNSRSLNLSSITSDLTLTFAGYTFAGWSNVSDGVYGISETLEPVAVAEATSSCIGVALINSVTNQRLMIEKYENANNTESANVYKTAAQKLNSTYTYYFTWGGYGSTSGTFTSPQVGAGSTNYCGYLSKPDGNYSGSPNLNSAPSTWTVSGGALSDFAGKSNSEFIMDITTNGSYSIDTAPMSYLMKAVNDVSCSAAVNQGYKDWYIPSCGQLGLIWLNKSALDKALTAVGGTALSSAGGYLSSTEYSTMGGWYVDLGNGFVNYSMKYNAHRVRLVRDLI